MINKYKRNNKNEFQKTRHYNLSSLQLEELCTSTGKDNLKKKSLIKRWSTKER